MKQTEKKIEEGSNSIAGVKKKKSLSFADFIKKAAEKQYKKELKNAAKNRK